MNSWTMFTYERGPEVTRIAVKYRRWCR